MALVAPDGRWLQVNQSLCKLVGYTEQELLATTFQAITHPDDLETDLMYVRQMLAGAIQTYQMEKRYFHKSGNVIWGLLSVSLVRNGNGQPLYFISQIQDITERKRAEQALSESEQKSRELSLIAQRQARELSLLEEVRSAISQELDLSVILHTVVEAIAHTFEYQLVSLYLIQGDRLVLQHQVGYIHTIPEIPLGHGITSKAILSGEPILIQDVRTDPNFMGVTEGIVSEIAVPLYQKDKVVGVLNVESTQGVELTQNDVHLLIAMSKIINIAFQRAQLYQAEHEQRVLAEALADTARAMTSTLNLHEVFKRILANVGRVVAHECANMMLVEQGVARIVDGLGYSEQGLKDALSIRLRVAETPNLQRMSDTGQPIIIPDIRLQEDWVDVAGARWIRSYAGAPIQVKGKTVGFINLNAAVPGFYTESDAQRLQAFAHQAAVAVENAQLYDRIQEQAITDQLTGAYNRRGLFEMGRREVERALRNGHLLAALILDIDHFKVVNDTYGHLTGDRVLQLLTRRCLDHIRKIDIFGRFGGEEFVILLPDCDSQGAIKIGERLRKCVEGEPFQTESRDIRITISLGAATVRVPDDLASLIGRADKALYAAKQAGRNRLELF
jgi:diguanylate cyclase (GGDEF)-like protein/PAS domain S-box-containing protein